MTQWAIGKSLKVNVKFYGLDIVEARFRCLNSEMNFTLSLLSKEFELEDKTMESWRTQPVWYFSRVSWWKQRSSGFCKKLLRYEKSFHQEWKILVKQPFLLPEVGIRSRLFPGSLLTPPSEEAIIEDIKITKRLGYNGARKHQKVEDPLYLYWCDKLGLLVWGEMASFYEFTNESVSQYMREWQEIVDRD